LTILASHARMVERTGFAREAQRVKRKGPMFSDMFTPESKFRDACNCDPLHDYATWFLSEVGSYEDLIELVMNNECSDIPDHYKSKVLNFASDISYWKDNK
jgi:hypothetical protein